MQQQGREKSWLNIALPKGRLGDKAYKLLAGAGYSATEDYNDHPQARGREPRRLCAVLPRQAQRRCDLRRYKRLTGLYEGVLTGKGLTYGGSLARTQATGYGLIYILDEMLKHNNKELAGKPF